ncbi:MAG: glycosyltransferase [Actinomycetota bacterium]|nr:glycosyltransferase [Actinomycetota bacterium]
MGRGARTDRHPRLPVLGHPRHLKHDPALLLELAAAVTQHAKVVVVSSGIGADWVREPAAQRRLDNLDVLPFQPYERLPEVFASGDVLVALLEPDAGVFSVPSKALSYHCAGQAILCAVPAENLAARIVERHETGLTVAPGDVGAFVAAARRLLRDEGLRRESGRNARRYAEATFDIAAIADRFEAVIQRARIRRGRLRARAMA